MSTNINISVDDNKLLEQARQQQAASRQAQLEKEANQRLEAQAAEERTKALAAKGLDANGNPLLGTSSPQPEVDRRPAANRQDLLEVVRFYSRGTEDNRFLISGDGTQEVPFSLPAPLTIPEFPVLNNDTPYPTYTPPTPTPFRLLAQQETRTELTFDPLNPSIATSYNDLTEAQDKRRAVLARSFDETRSFPLGNGAAFVVRGRYFAYASVITRHSYSYTRFTDNRQDAPILLKDTLNSQSLAVEIENDWIEQEDWVGAIVGKSSAQLTTVPQAIKDAIIRESQDTETIDFGVQSRVCLPAASNLGQAEQGTNYDEGKFQCAGWPGTYGFEVYAINEQDRDYLFLIQPSSLRSNNNRDVASSSQSTYGFAFDGQRYIDTFSASPAAWFNIDSKEVDDAVEGVLTHEELYAVAFSNGRLFGDLFKSKALVSFDDDGLKWTGTGLQGDVFTFPSPTDPSWRQGVRFAPREPLEEDFQAHYVYDWGQQAFCRQQAVRYGIAVT